jgi:hypothetical protein
MSEQPFRKARFTCRDGAGFYGSPNSPESGASSAPRAGPIPPAPGPGEVIVLPPLRATRHLAARIQRAYLRRQPWLPQMGQNPGVWTIAAIALLRAHQEDPRVPLDPELFVAVQPMGAPIADPWGDLTQEAATRHYCRCVHRIIGRLLNELRAEVRMIRRRIQRGEAIEAALRRQSRDLTPLGRFIAAHRVGRPDLAEPFRAAATDQHRSCPLYRPASLRLIPAEAYPAGHARTVESVLPQDDFQDSSYRWN